MDQKLTLENYKDHLGPVALNKINYLHKEEGMFIDQMINFINDHDELPFICFYDTKYIFFRESGVVFDFTSPLILDSVKISISADEMEDLYLSIVDTKEPLLDFELKEELLKLGMKYQEYCSRPQEILIKQFIGTYDTLINFVDDVSKGKYLDQK